MPRPFRRILALTLFGLCPNVHAQEGYAAPDLGLSMGSPGATWIATREEPASSGDWTFEFREEGDEDHAISLILWQLEDAPGLAALCDSELKQMAARGEVRRGASDEREVAGLAGLSIRYELTRPEDVPPLRIDATYFRGDGFLGRLAVKLPTSEAERLDGLIEKALAAIRIDEVVPSPVDFGPPDPAHILTVVHAADADELVYNYLEALPGAARATGGPPVVLALGETIQPAAHAFLRKFRPGTIRLVGLPHPELPQAEQATDDWPSGKTVVVSSRELGPAVQAACLALRLGVPLVIDRGDLRTRLAEFEPERVLTIGSVTTAGIDCPVEALAGPAQIARAAGGANYLALCNVAEGPGAESAALAAVLAAAREGVVLPIDESVTRHQIPLRRSDECPSGLEGLAPGDHYLVGEIPTASGAILAGAPQTTTVRVATDESPRYGRLRIDLDGDGRLEADEEPRIGSAVELGGRSLHLTYHYGHAFVSYLSAEIILDELHPEVVRDAIRDLASELVSVEFLAIVGTPARVPFCYREATGYFEAYDIKQELPSDAPYADLDDDEYLELAVGRLPVEDLIAGSAMIATTVAYPRLKGDWRKRATVIQPGFAELEGALPWVLPNAEALIRGVEGDLVASEVEASTFYRDDVEIDDVIEAMSQSAWIAYFNHSGPGSWGIHPGSSIVTSPRSGKSDRSLPALAGAPIVFGGGCSSAALDVGSPLTATFPGRFFELGAVAYLGNTRVASGHSEQLVQTFFAGLASGERTLGEAYRDGRNFLTHLLEGGHLLGPLDRGVDPGLRDFLRGQHQILNLFGDPALCPTLPASPAASIEVALTTTDDLGVLRLRVTNRGADRLDPIQMMPAYGQGSPREFFVRAGPGMTSSYLPGQFVRQGLAPVKSISETPPGAWVDVELPSGASDVEVELTAGPEWADRGFAIRPGSHDESRLLMYVPLVRSTLEHGDGAVAREVEFEVRFQTTSQATASRTVPRVRAEKPWEPARSGKPRISARAKAIITRIEERYERTGSKGGLDGVTWTMSNPQPRLYGADALFHGRWDAAGRSSLEASCLPADLEARWAELADALQQVSDLPFRCPLPALEGMRVQVSSPNVLVLTPLTGGEGDEQTEVHVDDEGTIQRVVERHFGVASETKFEWSSSSSGLHLTRCSVADPVRPQNEAVYEIAYESRDGALRPSRVTLRVVGKLPRDYHFDFDYPMVF